jgi:hypothetical protein
VKENRFFNLAVFFVAATLLWSLATPNTAQANGSRRDGQAPATAKTSSDVSLPDSWESADIGGVVLTGEVEYLAGAFVVKGSGSDIAGTAVEFHYVYKPLTGDVQIVARIVDIGAGNPEAKAGVMIRESLTAGARSAALLMNAMGSAVFQARKKTDHATISKARSFANFPSWIMLTRVGDIFVGSISNDGLDWQVLRSVTVRMAETVYVGLAVSSRDPGQLNTVAFDNVNTTGKKRVSTLSSLTLNPTNVSGGTSASGTVTLSAVAPSGGAVVAIGDSNTAVTSAPASVLVPAGSKSASFAIATSTVISDTSASFTANYGGNSKSATLSITATSAAVELSSLTLSAASVTGGNSTQATVSLTGAAPFGGAVVALSSSDSAIADVPASVTVAEGSSSASVTVTTSTVSASTSVTLTATYNGISVTATLTVNPPPTGAPQSGGVTYYVSTTGSDANPGTTTQPFRTIQRAADLVNPGDTVIVDDGIYTYNGTNYCSPVKTVVCAARGGTSANWVVFKSKNRWGAKIDGQNNTVDNGWTFQSNAGYVRIEGFEFYGMGSSGGSSSAIEAYSGGHDIEVVGNDVHDVGRQCTQTTNGLVGIYANQNNVVIEQNSIHDIGRFAPGESGCSYPTGYIGYQTHDHGIYLSAGDDVTVRNNLIYNIRRGWGVQVYPNSRARLNILNNTFAFGNPDQHGHIVLYQAAITDSNIKNNIFYQPTVAAIYIGGGATFTNTAIANNLTDVGQIADATPSGIVFSGNRVNTNPAFVNAAGLDFHLQAGSPGIDAGQTLMLVTNDYEGRARPMGIAYDIGAYEYSSTTAQAMPSWRYNAFARSLARYREPTALQLSFDLRMEKTPDLAPGSRR